MDGTVDFIRTLSISPVVGEPSETDMPGDVMMDTGFYGEYILMNSDTPFHMSFEWTAHFLISPLWMCPKILYPDGTINAAGRKHN